MHRFLKIVILGHVHCGKSLWKCKALPLKRNYFAMNYNWYLIFDHLCFNANILQQATQSFCIFMTFFCNCRDYRIITKIIQIFCFGSKNFCTEIQKSCSIQHNYFEFYEFFLHLCDFSNYSNPFAIVYKNIFAILLQKYAKNTF